MSNLFVYDDPTLAAYQRYAQAAIAEWRTIHPPSSFLRRFAKWLRQMDASPRPSSQRLPPKARVLDYGCGIGLELAWLKQQGFRVEGIDGTRAFVREARRRNSKVPIRQARFDEARLSPAAYDGIWCQAALMHLTPEALAQALRTLRAALKPRGILGVTLAWGRRKGVVDNDWLAGRYIAAYTKPEAMAFFNNWRVLEGHVTAHDGRSGRWIQLLATPAARAAS